MNVKTENPDLLVTPDDLIPSEEEEEFESLIIMRGETERILNQFLMRNKE